ncbi:protein FAM210A-like isoform X2 [Gordionus sp. m RMFG-2023]|uniref:protein FAM210A-like isoform X2 n=1 Tax=Gordionus sp. m RMFG-2023 TaxID=3053472 RepID=UPI0031FC15E3
MILYRRLVFSFARKSYISNYVSKFLYYKEALVYPSFNTLDSNYKGNFLPRYFSSTSTIHNKTDNQQKNELIPKQKTEPDENDKSLSAWQRFKIMMKKYWYVLIPVHAVTTAFWLCSFCGLDIVPLLEKLSIPEKYIDPIKKSGASNFAVAYALYKIITPIRYGVTLGVTTFSINYLRKLGYIKHVPSSQQIKKMVRSLREERIKKRAKRENKKL